MRIISALCVALLVPSFVQADDRKRELIECINAEGFVKMANGLAKLEDKHKDTISTQPSITLTPNDGGVLPDRLFYRLNNDIIDLPLSETGEVSNFIKTFEGDKSAEFCAEDPTRVGNVETGDTFRLDMQFNMNFHNRSGTYLIAELEDGLKDGKATLKKIVGGPKALLVPSMSHIYVQFDEKPETARFRILQDGEDAGAAPFEKLGDAYMVSFEWLEEMNADGLLIEGGPHKLSPSLSPKKMAKAMGLDEKE